MEDKIVAWQERKMGSTVLYKFYLECIRQPCIIIHQDHCNTNMSFLLAVVVVFCDKKKKKIQIMFALHPNWKINPFTKWALAMKHSRASQCTIYLGCWTRFSSLVDIWLFGGKVSFILLSFSRTTPAFHCNPTCSPSEFRVKKVAFLNKFKKMNQRNCQKNRMTTPSHVFYSPIAVQYGSHSHVGLFKCKRKWMKT